MILPLLLKSTALTLLSLATKVPFVYRFIPSSRIHRLISVAGLQDLKYGTICSRASYCPWKSDADFQRIFREVRSHTLVDEYRCHELWDLCGQIDTLEPGDLLEVGVWRGGTGCLLARRTAKNVADTVFLCDTFSGVVKAGSVDSAYVGGEHADTSKTLVENLCQKLGLANVKIPPAATGPAIADRRFRLCHIDVDVYESAAQTFEWVWPRLVPGGLVVFDDYGFYSCGGVTRFVNQMRGLKDRLVIYNVNGHALVIKKY